MYRIRGRLQGHVALGLKQVLKLKKIINRTLQDVIEPKRKQNKNTTATKSFFCLKRI